MSSSPDGAAWRQSLKAFFEQRGRNVVGAPTLEDLCYIAGRDPRLWQQPLLDDLRDSLLRLMSAGSGSRVLEVGCAAGFLARLVAPRVASYTGLDLADAPLTVARRLGLANARFIQTSTDVLPFADSSFDAVFCYDVFTNYPTAADGKALVGEMLRVAAPGRPVLLGPIPDRAMAAKVPALITRIASSLDAAYGPLAPRSEQSLHVPVARPPAIWKRALDIAFSRNQVTPVSAPPPAIVTFDFEQRDFLEIGRDLGANARIEEVHSMSPYLGFRFNVIFSRPDFENR